MATEKKTEEAAAPAKTRYAILRRGRVYYLGKKPFERGKPEPVTQEEEDYLAEHAVDEVTVEGENEFQSRSKFEFVDSLDDEPDGKGSLPARTRRR